MFKRPTVLIVGAGCSAELGLPVGNALKGQIADQLSRIARVENNGGIRSVSSRTADDKLLWAIQRTGQAAGSREWLAIANGLADGIRHAPSIDNYLHLHRDDQSAVAIGKLAIAREIIRAERASYLPATGVDLPRIRKEKEARKEDPHLWLQELVSHAQADVPRADMGQIFNDLTIVTFNYDRVIEHYLYHSIMQLARLTEAEAADAMSKLKIIHPYGKIGRLPWQPQDDCAILPYGGGLDLDEEALLDAGKRLRTFTETVDEPEIIGPMHKAIREAQQVVFLGFSFLPQNLKLMMPTERCSTRVCYATRLYESDANVRIAEGEIGEMLRSVYWSGPIPVRWADMTSGKFMHDFGRELTS